MRNSVVTSQSPVLLYMRSRYLKVTEKLEIEAAKRSAVWQVKQHLSKVYSNKIKITDHVALRIWQRFSEEDQQIIFNEIQEIAECGMHKHLFLGNEDRPEIILNNGVTLILGKDKKRIAIVTVFTRREKCTIKANT